MYAIIPFIIVAILQVGMLGSTFLSSSNTDSNENDSSLSGVSLWFPGAGDDPEYVLDMTDGCAEWATNVLTSSGSGCGSGGGSGMATTSIDTETELESVLTDVTDLFTNNDGALADDDLSDDDLDALQNVAAMTEANGDVLYYNSSAWQKLAKGSDGEVLKLASGLPSWAVDATGGGVGLSTSSPFVDTYVPFATGVSTLGVESAFTYDDATDLLTFVNGSSTFLSATTFWGALVGNSDTATALAANGGNCPAGSYPLGVDASGAIESCTDATTEIDSAISASGHISATLTEEQVEDFVGGMVTGNTETDIAVTYQDGDGTIDFVVSGHYVDADVSSYLTGGTGITESGGTISFDCSEVEGTGIDCATEAITLDATGDWTGTLDSQEGSYYLDFTNQVVSNGEITPNMIHATGQTDEYCLTYELTGNTYEWQSCAGGATPWTDNGTWLSPSSSEFIDVPYIVATSSSATSTFANSVLMGGVTNYPSRGISSILELAGEGKGGDSYGGLYIHNDATSGGAFEIRAEGPRVDFEFVEDDQATTTGEGKWELEASGNNFCLNSRNTANTSFDRLMCWAQLQKGGMVGIGTAFSTSFLDAQFTIASTSESVTGALDYFHINEDTDSEGDLFTVKKSGNVGIASSTPNTALVVTGTLTIDDGSGNGLKIIPGATTTLSFY